MSDFRDEIVDPAVSAHYKALADEQAPGSLDRQVLEAAGKALPRHAGWWRTWYRPLTLAATIGLSFAFVLQLGDLSLSVGPPDQPGSPPALSPDVFQDAGRENAERFQHLQTESERLMRPDPTMIRPFTEPADAASATVDGNQQPASPQCAEHQRRDASTWWNCIRELEKSGHRQAAEVELQTLLKSFPTFERPQ